MDLPLHKISARNTTVSYDPEEGVVSVKYFNTEILRASRRDQNIRISTGGWITNPMMTRLNQAMKAMGLKYRVRHQMNQKKQYPEIAVYDLDDGRATITEPLSEYCVNLNATFNLPLASVV